MNHSASKFGAWSAVAAFIATTAFVFVQILQILGIFQYPWDEILIYGFSQLIAPPFVLAMLALHYRTSAEKRYFSHAALLCSVVYLIFVTANYVVQLATVIPETLKGNASSIQVLVQTPHSMFWNFDAIGYIFMGFAVLLALPAINKSHGERFAWIAFLVHGLTTPLISFVYFYPDFSTGILLLGLPWAITAPIFMLCLAIILSRSSPKP